ncbi:hypothetical protein BDV95DRAFT_596536 [Massariosphaeria phaeospora]|uniref:Uncharacterized protein n=1 Tax=Massariosphaeria phaeospora TaxID=100035 RepID=A0A7C8M7H9_9PLEO|nr:hypothetical protein BDV95DRAFT_596536 [Massariosphaeria phaeospora]
MYPDVTLRRGGASCRLRGVLVALLRHFAKTAADLRHFCGAFRTTAAKGYQHNTTTTACSAIAIHFEDSGCAAVLQRHFRGAFYTTATLLRCFCGTLGKARHSCGISAPGIRETLLLPLESAAVFLGRWRTRCSTAAALIAPPWFFAALFAPPQMAENEDATLLPPLESAVMFFGSLLRCSTAAALVASLQRFLHRCGTSAALFGLPRRRKRAEIQERNTASTTYRSRP